MPTAPKPQTYANRVKLQPPFHFFVVPLLAIFLVLSVEDCVRNPNQLTISLVVLAIALLPMALLIRMNALRVQDRVIRLEEQLRMATLLPEELRRRSGELSVSQLVALRFASDAELPLLVSQALDGKLSNKQIKEKIQSWRPDYIRV